MLGTRRHSLGTLPTVFCVIGCDREDPLGPSRAVAFRLTETPSTTVATPASPTRIDVSWEDRSSNASGFEVHRSTTGATGAFSLLATTGANATSYSDAGLTGHTEYCYCNVDCSIPSNKATVSTPP